MDELIRKKDAIEAINIWLYCDKDERMPADVIKALLPVYVPVINVGDMISRQAAIDEAVAYIEEWNNAKSEYHKKEITRRFQNLPSAQAERTCVNCGRTVNNGGWYADGSTRCPIEEHYALPKDGYCHLWEKRNVTDDDYPERREE